MGPEIIPTSRREIESIYPRLGNSSQNTGDAIRQTTASVNDRPDWEAMTGLARVKPSTWQTTYTVLSSTH